METNEINLKPCPFCGSSASMRHGARYGHWVQCDECGVGHPFVFDTEEGAAAAWNSRAPEAETWTSDGDAPGNAAAMREALEQVQIGFDNNVIGPIGDRPNDWEIDEAKRLRVVVDSALAAPVRNCDVGTAEEQAKRFRDFCTEHSSIITGMCDGTCPLQDCADGCHCVCMWAQLPYEAEGGSK